MNQKPRTTTELHSELLLLPNGSVLAHNLTPTLAAVLQKLGIEYLDRRAQSPRVASLTMKQSMLRSAAQRRSRAAR